ncbi:MAG TPA: hypothetical protein VLF65_13655 [Burkholderiales bacterium]|nr:hypothetical protein [Burkholderiales bacterium]
MELSRTIGWTAIVLAVILAAGYANGEAGPPAATNKTVEEQPEAQEAQRGAAVEEAAEQEERLRAGVQEAGQAVQAAAD